MTTNTVVVVGVGVVVAVAACVEQFKVLLRTSELSSLKSYSGLRMSSNYYYCCYYNCCYYS